jgi:hypothetical protein
MNITQFLDKNDIFYCYLEHRGPKKPKRNVFSTSGIPVVSTFQLTSIRNSYNKDIIKAHNINSQEDYLEALRRSKKSPSEWIAYDTSKVACLDIDDKRIDDTLKKLKEYVPYVNSSTKKMPHYFINFQQDKLRLEYPIGADWLTGQYSYALSNTIVNNSDRKIPTDINPESIHQWFFPYVPLVGYSESKEHFEICSNSGNEDIKIDNTGDRHQPPPQRFLNQVLIKDCLKAVIKAGQGEEMTQRSDWVKYGTFCKFHLSYKPKSYFKNIMRTARGNENTKLSSTQWNSWRRIMDERWLINKLGKYSSDSECQRLKKLLVAEFNNDDSDSELSSSESEEEEEEKEASVTPNRPVDTRHLSMLVHKLKYVTLKKKYKQVKNDEFALERFYEENQKIREEVLRIVAGSIAHRRGSKPTLITLYYNEVGLVQKYQEHPSVLDCRNNWKKFNCYTFDLDTHKKAVFDPVKIIWDGDSESSFRTYDELDCRPCEECPYDPYGDDNILNIWCGWKHYPFQPELDIDYDLIKPILHHLQIVMANDKFNGLSGNKLYNYVMCWFKSILLGNKNRSHLYWYGEMGIGKSLFIDYFANQIVGPKCSESFRDLSIVTKEFNSMGANASFIVFNEVPNHSTNKTMASAMKDMTTNNYQNVTKKFCETKKMRDNKSYGYLSNFPDGISVETKMDRRTVIIQCCPKYRKNKKYFDNLIRLMGLGANGKWTDTELSSKVAKHLTNYFIRWDDSKWDPEDIPKTIARVRQEQNTTPYRCRFLRVFFKNLKKKLIEDKNKKMKVRCDDIYRAWYEYNEETSWGRFKRSFEKSMGAIDYSSFMKNFINKAIAMDFVPLNRLQRKEAVGGKHYWLVTVKYCDIMLEQLESKHSYHPDDEDLELASVVIQDD